MKTYNTLGTGGSTGTGLEVLQTSPTIITPTLSGAVTFNNAVSGITTLTGSGAISGFTSLALSAGISGVTTLSGTGAISGFTTVAVTGNVTQTVNAGNAIYKAITNADANIAVFWSERTGITNPGVWYAGMRNGVATYDIFDNTNNKLMMRISQNTGLFQWTQYGAGALTADSSGNITAVSDERAKRNIRPYVRGIKEIMGLSPIMHGYTKKSGLDQRKDDYAGFSAQNVRDVMPEAVGHMPDGMLTLADRPILAAMVNAMKELNGRVIRMETAQ